MIAIYVCTRPHKDLTLGKEYECRNPLEGQTYIGHPGLLLTNDRNKTIVLNGEQAEKYFTYIGSRYETLTTQNGNKYVSPTLL
jgi:hypothetical protein